jgi:hypothetical protein
MTTPQSDTVLLTCDNCGLQDNRAPGWDGAACTSCDEGCFRIDWTVPQEIVGDNSVIQSYQALIEPLKMGISMPGDSVNHPSHYNLSPSGVECIDVVEHLSFNIGNAIKYLWRHEHKNGVEDLKKARFYIDREIQRLDKKLQDVPSRP